MRGFQDRTEVSDVVALLMARLRPLATETVPLREAAGRVLAGEITAEVDVPGFDRAAMDGYALRGSETFGAGPYNPLEFEVVGLALPGKPYPNPVQPGQAVRIMTGAPLPPGADAVLQAEAAELTGNRLRVSEPVPPARHVGRRGEDIDIGTVVLHAPRVLRPQDLGLLASLGVGVVTVVRRPTVDILVTGDELLPCGAKPEGYRIVDSNSIMLDALVRRDGGLVRSDRIHAVGPSSDRMDAVTMNPATLIPDTRESVRAALLGSDADVILVSGGSSVGQEDHAPRVLAEVGELTVHGVALRPASPAGVGFLRQRPVFLLPGNPVSCLCAYDLFAGRAIRRLGGRSIDLPYRIRKLPLARKIASPAGRVDYVRVQIIPSPLSPEGRGAGVRDIEEKVDPLATSGASILSSTTRADGFVLVPRDSEGYAAGEPVEVFLYDG
jgi:molybdopterin molybdotransferase